MPQYFFTIRGRDRVEDDPDGTYLPDVAAALYYDYAEYTIRELRKKTGYHDRALMMIVKDQASRRFCPCRFCRAVDPRYASEPH